MADERRVPEGVEARGKGWYRLPSGRRVRGKDAVFDALANGEEQVARSASEGSIMLERLDFARRAGMQYGGARDVYEVAGYKKKPQFGDYWSYYDRHPIAGRIIDLPANTTWRNGAVVVEPDKEDGTEFTEAVEELVNRLGLWDRLARVDRLARIGEYAVLLIGVKDGGQDLSLPLVGGLEGPDDIAYLAQYSQQSAKIKTWVTDRQDERFGLPEMYEIDLSRSNPNFQGRDQAVHWSRVIHVAEDRLEDDVHGRPVLRRVLNTVFNDEKVDAASAEAFWQLGDQVLQLKIDPEARLDKDKLDEVDEKLQLLYHNLRKHFYLQGGELSWVGGNTPDPSAISGVLAKKMAAGAGIPERILFGSERGELASSQDERNWMGTVAERREHHAEPNILRLLVDRLVELGALPRPGEDGYEVQWPNLFEPTDQERAQKNKATAETAKALTPVGGDPLDLVDIDDDGMVTLRPSEVVREEREKQLEEMDRQDPGPPEAAGDGGEDEEEGEEPRQGEETE